MANKRQISHLVTTAVALALLALVAAVLASCGDSPTNTPSAITSPATTGASQTTNAPPTTAPTLAATTAPTISSNTTTPGVTTSAAGNPVPDQIKPVFQAVTTDLNKRNQIDPSNIQLLSYQSIDFPDSSLGCPQPNTMYSQVITPGYVLSLTANGQSYEYHSNRSGSHVVLCSGKGLQSPVNP